MPQFDLHFLSSLLFWSLMSFGVLLFLLKRFALPQILEALDARERKIKDSIDQAEKIQKEAEQRLAEYEAKLRGVQLEAHELIETARQKSQELLDENEKRARQDSARLVAEARSEIERERQEAIRAIQTAAVELTINAAQKILERKIDSADDRRMVEATIDELARHTRK